MSISEDISISLVYRKTGSGNDVFFQLLHNALSEQTSWDIELISVPSWHERFPYKLSLPAKNNRSRLAVTHLELAPYIKKEDSPLLSIAHHDPVANELMPFLSPIQRIYYKAVLGRQFKKGMAHSDAIVTGSSFTNRQLKENYTKPIEGKIHLIKYGIDTSFYTPGDNSKKFCSPYKLLFVGNLSKRKGFDLVPHILKELGPQFQISYTTGLRSHSSECPVNDQMIPLPRLSREELRNAYREADVLLFPSRLEGFGYAAAEAMACGLPVVGASSTTIAEITPPWALFSLSPSFTPSDFASAVKRVLADPPAPDKLHEHISQHFSVPRMAGQYIQLIRSLL